MRPAAGPQLSAADGVSDAEGLAGRQALPAYPRTRDLGGDVWSIDTFHHGNPGTIAVFLLRLPGGGYAMIESGPGVSRPEIEAGLAELGVTLSEIDYLLVTHIHLDHAGGVGALAQASGGQVIVHRIGAKHLIDPSRLMASARRVYGEQLDSLWGAMEPVAEERLRAVDDGDRLDLGGLGVRVLHTPGHASHHVSYLLNDGTMFAGDSAGVKLAGATTIRPALPPPDLDLQAAERSVALMIDNAPTRLILTHFGPVDDPLAHLRAVPVTNRRWEAAFREGQAAGEDDEALVRRIEALEDAELAADSVPAGIAARYKITSDAAMTVSGLKRYVDKFGQSSFPLGRPARIAVLASGRGSNLAALLQAFPKGGGEPGEVVLTVSDKSGAPALAKATVAGVTAAYIPWKDRSTFESMLLELLDLHKIDLICLAGFMRLLSADFTKRYQGRLLNIHPSMLPAFRGLDPQRQALDAGVRETGCSVHFVDEGVDTGPVVLQRAVPILPGDSVETLSDRILEVEHELYPEAVRVVLRGAVRSQPAGSESAGSEAAGSESTGSGAASVADSVAGRKGDAG